MGLLQESKSRKRINNDPNNTKWTRDETTFGQRILRSQGWQPGQFLGAQDAPHSELHTSANASYIRVVLKDDMKGLGFNKAKEDEITGLDVFSDLLSRLNGKSEELIESDKQARLAVKTNIWVERKYGPMRFVRGGLLVGDKIEDESSSSSSSEEEKKEQVVSESKSDKKRKATAIDDDSKAAKKSKKQKKQSTTDDDESDESKPKKSKSKKDKKEKKEKKDKKKNKKSKSKDSDDSTSEVSEDEAKRLKKARKEEKRLKKEKKEKKNKESSSAVDTPADSGASTPRNRNFVRSRFIAQKRQAVLDTKALNQIFMLKT